MGVWDINSGGWLSQYGPMRFTRMSEFEPSVQVAMVDGKHASWMTRAWSYRVSVDDTSISFRHGGYDNEDDSDTPPGRRKVQHGFPRRACGGPVLSGHLEPERGSAAVYRHVEEELRRGGAAGYSLSVIG